MIAKPEAKRLEAGLCCSDQNFSRCSSEICSHLLEIAWSVKRSGDLFLDPIEQPLIYQPKLIEPSSQPFDKFFHTMWARGHICIKRLHSTSERKLPKQ